MLKCRKCDAELHPQQKVCPECGTPTPAGGGFYVEEERKWRPTPRMIRIAAGAAALLLIVVIGYRVLHVVPADIVAKEWFGAMVGRQIAKARGYVTPRLEQELSGRMMDLRALADEYYTEVVNNQATYAVGTPQSTGPKTASILIDVSYPGGEGGREVRLEMVKQGRRWMVDRIL